MPGAHFGPKYGIEPGDFNADPNPEQSICVEISDKSRISAKLCRERIYRHGTEMTDCKVPRYGGLKCRTKSEKADEASL